MPRLPETERLDAIKGLMSIHQDRRSVLKAAAAAGLIPVLSSETVAARAAARQDAQPVQGGTFVTLAQDSIEALSPEDTGETAQWVPIIQMFEPLYMVNENYELEPVLADSYEPSEDGLTYTFRLKEGVTFHNGDAFTANDVVYTYEWIMNPDNASTRQANFGLVESVEAPDDQTVVVKLTENDVTFMVSVATTLIYPAADHEAKGEDTFKGEPVGTGPFMLGEWNPQSRVVLNAYEDYYRGRPNFDSIQVDVVPEAAGRMSALESGQADNSIWGLNAEDNETLKESGNFVVFETVQSATNHFPLNNTHPFLGDSKEVRQALLMALDRELFAEAIFLGQAQVAHHNLSPAIEKYYNADTVKYEYDPEGAKALLDEAGWVEGEDGIREKDGVKAQFTMMVFQGDTQRRPEAEEAQQRWADIGVQCDLQEGITSDVLAGLVAGEYDAGLFNWVYGGGSTGDPDTRDTLVTGAANNFFNYSNEEVDQLMMDGVKELDENARIEIYKRIQEIIAEELPFLPLLHLQSITFYNNRIKGLPEDMLYSDNLYQKLYQLWIEEA
jgi:peptide/nickel transport system substrate-binding protein